MQKINIWYINNLFSRKIIFSLIIVFNLSFSQERTLENLPMADKKRFAFGFALSLVNTNFKIIPTQMGTLGALNNKNGGVNIAYIEPNIGFYASGYMNIWLIDNFLSYQLEAGGWLGKMSMRYRYDNQVFADFFNREFRDTDAFRDANMYIFYAPSFIKLTPLRINNYRPFIILGVSYMINLGSNEEYYNDNTDGIFRLRTDMFNWELGFGTDIYMSFFKLSISFRGIFGINDLLVRDKVSTPWTDPIEKMYFNTFSLSFIFSGSK